MCTSYDVMCMWFMWFSAVCKSVMYISSVLALFSSVVLCVLSVAVAFVLFSDY